VVCAAVIGFFAPDIWSFTASSRSAAVVASRAPETIVGRASVIDGDTLEIHGTRIRLHAIDAPESGQSCVVAGKATRCGQEAALALAAEIGNKTVSCTPTDRDRYGRTVAICHAGERNLNAWMVAEGWAIAYRQYGTDYVGEEAAAAAARRGLWQGEFDPPSTWRQDRAAAATPRRTESCAIKGNISGSGERIYHVPGGQYYAKTQVNAASGERWFCSEAEAKAAGWRRSRV